MLAYVAGVIDCDGSIQVARSLGPARKRDGVRPPYYVIRATLTAVDPTIPHLLRAHFGGSVYRFEGHTVRKGSWHRWTVVSLQAGAFLRAIRPYLRLKGPQADAALQLDALLASQRATQRGRPIRPVSERELAQRLALMHEVRRFNSRPQAAGSAASLPADG